VKTDVHWKKIGLGPHHGVCVPLFSLRSKKSCGIGEFNDLIPLIDWCRKTGLDCIQLLPLNDTGDDPSPYNALSSCALDPIYLSLSLLKDEKELALFAPLNALPHLNRKEVKQQKMKWLRDYFSQHFAALSQTRPYLDFLSQNPWLSSYAQFKVLSEQYNYRHWKDWPASHKAVSEEALHFHFFLQYLCFSQLEKVRAYASRAHVFLQGDVPILLSPNSADVWAEPHLFNLHLTAGAPPDYYNPLGQNWGFPLFDWQEMRKTCFQWWKQRLHVTSRLYHLYRIDHVVGFFRIWAIPLGKKPVDGSFIPADRSTWQKQGLEILEMMIDSCPLLPLAEDLGTIPDEVYPTLKNLGICGTKVIRWERDKNRHYLPYATYEPLSVTTVSTWDCEPLRLWWEHYPDEAKAFADFKGWSYQPELFRDEIFEILRDAHHTPSYFHINLLQEYLSLFPDLRSSKEEERINIPGTLSATNWTYRFYPYLEEMLEHKGLQEAIWGILHKPLVM
jgi:4-alpha-glucanotransferase